MGDTAMPWIIDKSNASYSISVLTPAAQAKFDLFQNAIQQQGLHPKQAADTLGASDYKNLSGTNLFQIRLDGFNRVTFELDAATQTVNIVQVGGHS
jgi:outer membrane protein TolC